MRSLSDALTLSRVSSQIELTPVDGCTNCGDQYNKERYSLRENVLVYITCDEWNTSSGIPMNARRNFNFIYTGNGNCYCVASFFLNDFLLLF